MTQDVDEEEADALEEDFLGARLDPFSLLEGMSAQGQGDETESALQPYEILARTAMQARAVQAGPSGRPGLGPGEEARIPLISLHLMCTLMHLLQIFDLPNIQETQDCTTNAFQSGR